VTGVSKLRLNAGQAHVDIVPQIGGSLAGYWSETNEGPQHWLRPMSAEGLKAGDVLTTSCFPLVPFSSRIPSTGKAGSSPGPSKKQRRILPVFPIVTRPAIGPGTIPPGSVLP